MWEILIQALKSKLKSFTFKSIKRRVKTKASSPFKFAKTIIKNPKKVATKKITNPVRRTKSKIRQAKRLGKFAKLLISPKARLIEKVTQNAMLLTSVIDEENLLTAGKINGVRDQSEISKQIVQTKGILRGRKTDEINDINKAILKELAGVGLDSQEKIARIIEDEEFREALVKANGYDTYIEHWKNGWFGYAAEAQGYSEAEMEIIWEQIVNDNSFENFREKKFS